MNKTSIHPIFQTRNMMSAITGEDDYSQLGTAQMGFDLEQLPSVDMPFPSAAGTPFSLTSSESNVAGSSAVTSPLSASLPANFGHVTLSKLTRRTEEGGRVKPPPPYPTSPPQKSGNNSALQELLSIRSPGRLPSPNPTGLSIHPPAKLRRLLIDESIRR